MENMADIKTSIIESSKKILSERKNPVLILDLKEISKGVLFVIHDLLCKKQFEALDVVLQTPGGDIDAAFLITKVLRKHAKKVNVIVPLYAKSAGTLMCLGADEILMTDLSELGPLDTQISEQQDGGHFRYTSALNGFKALEQVQLHTIETLDIATKLILARSSMKISEAVRLATEFSGQTSGTLYSKLNPEKIGEYARALEIGERYGIMLLTRYRSWNPEKADTTIKTLVKQYPSHGFIIDVEELQSLGLPASRINDKLIDVMIELRRSLLKTESDIIELVEGQTQQNQQQSNINKPNQNQSNNQSK